MSQTIISMANALHAPKSSLESQPQHDIDDRLDAARALLGVSPPSVAESGPVFGPQSGTALERGGTENSDGQVSTNINNQTSLARAGIQRQGRPRSDSAGLEALAFLATREQASMVQNGHASSVPVLAVAGAVSSSSDDDSEAMPPPPPRFMTTRRRSISNPEGMEKWVPKEKNRLHLVLPAAILEEELAEANAAMKAKEEQQDATPPENENQIQSQDDSNSVLQKKPIENEETLDQNELLRRARSRLLEDLSEGNLNGEKGEVTLPHSLAKYKEVYNKNGRIGIYTAAERAAIISRFHSKRARRVWNKKIRYNCRKNLADRRMRVKGRFVKRSTEEQAKAALAKTETVRIQPIPETEEAKGTAPEPSPDNTNTSSTCDEEMPDVSDPDAGFCPTDEQPYRRLRRHTIT